MQLTSALYATLDANRMHGGDVHVRLMVTRGIKSTPYQDPRVTVGPATIVIIPEYKTASTDTAARGLSLFTVHVRRGAPDVQDPSSIRTASSTASPPASRPMARARTRR